MKCVLHNREYREQHNIEIIINIQNYTILLKQKKQYLTGYLINANIRDMSEEHK